MPSPNSPDLDRPSAPAAIESYLKKAGRGLAWGLSQTLMLPIRFYRVAISPVIGPNCRFEPTCSAYALEALAKHGPLRGSWLTLRRLSRCHPITWLGGSSGYDPVPPRRSASGAPLDPGGTK